MSSTFSSVFDYKRHFKRNYMIYILLITLCYHINYQIQRILNNGYIFSYGQLRSFRTILYIINIFINFSQNGLKKKSQAKIYGIDIPHHIICYHTIWSMHILNIGLVIIKMHITSYVHYG
jgi:hypothetical protein